MSIIGFLKISISAIKYSLRYQWKSNIGFERASKSRNIWPRGDSNCRKLGPERVKIAFLDVKKAFDLVSHQSLILATKRMGIPPPMFVYLQELYGDASTSIRIGPDRSELIGV